MIPNYDHKVASLSTEKALAMAAYGESVAAYRYRTLCDHPAGEEHRETFKEMADEEQGHHQKIQALLKKHFPGSDFVLAVEDKEMVIVGPRMLDFSTPELYARALEMMGDSERLTGRFYAAVFKMTDRRDLKPLLKEMSEECFEHANLLSEISR